MNQHAENAQIDGIGVSPGLVVGPVAHMGEGIKEPSATVRYDGDPELAREQIAQAAAATKAGLEAMAERASGEGRAVLEMTAQMAGDKSLIKNAAKLVANENLTPARAVWQAALAIGEQLESLGGYMAERTRDVADVRDRIVARLTGQDLPGIPDLPEPFVLVARDLAPADTALLDPEKVIGIVTAEGGPTSHTAILARDLGIPAIVGVGGAAAATLPNGTYVLVDGSKGTVKTNPSVEDMERVAALKGIKRTFSGKGLTKDGHHVQLLGNVGDAASAKAAASAGAEGVGLFRTEFAFLDKAEEPSHAEQVAAYRAVFAEFPGKKVVVRTLDAGADKPLPFVTDYEEENPALGVRGFRTAKTHPHVLTNQLAALAAAAKEEQADVWVMTPMIATLPETEQFIELCSQVGLTTAGIMIEVPSAALTADRLLAKAQFASIGTNDLTQYAMAADRMLGSLAELSTVWQPGVLSLIAATCEGGRKNDRPVGVCGESAADPALAVVLVGLGVKSLSMTSRALPDVAMVLESLTLAECQHIAQVALQAADAEHAKAAARALIPVLEELGL
ncbi:phosphoenolpyruvate--protein phosphotransferase [Buchananella hordeovulneris]|uniref:Phosphoenolpyruvate-protein phosphotransferase n=1 Tax=Buchananella hordeovulneris TaxID=52770 RepID=A0A1Q5PWZ2_9ACTO|nr:phosphoenolpyruvate--protein phosphotransferase [Buchananella hordeovulneris]MDO5081739.1 phosphoenolpyruvate--protein phosphotransferase [Buchananella hordeovulneris]OKL52077.1 phosphoenolpyruvate--protein phosphotransferase [Buchananella hordeovulneris]